jgi:hypothetical protein
VDQGAGDRRLHGGAFSGPHAELEAGELRPIGWESNWITTKGKEPYVWLRLSGPEEAFWKNTFKMPDMEIVKWGGLRRQDAVPARRQAK